MFGKTMRKFLQRLSPKRRIAALVDAVIDRINEKYRLEGEIQVVDGGMKFHMQIVDTKPADRIDLPSQDDEE